VSTAKGRLASKYPPPEQLETITVHIEFMQKGSGLFHMKFLPDTGANITALDITQATGIILEDKTVNLKVANGTYLKTLGTVEMNFTMNGTTAPELIYVVEGLSEPLLSRRMLKVLGLLPQTWPTINIQEAVTNWLAKKANTDKHRRPHENSYVTPQIVRQANTWKYSTSPISDLVTTGLKPQ
jgi:predicted aspartyl protease